MGSVGADGGAGRADGAAGTRKAARAGPVAGLPGPLPQGQCAGAAVAGPAGARGLHADGQQPQAGGVGAVRGADGGVHGTAQPAQVQSAGARLPDNAFGRHVAHGQRVAAEADGGSPRAAELQRHQNDGGRRQRPHLQDAPRGGALAKTIARHGCQSAATGLGQILRPQDAKGHSVRLCVPCHCGDAVVAHGARGAAGLRHTRVHVPAQADARGGLSRFGRLDGAADRRRRPAGVHRSAAGEADAHQHRGHVVRAEPGRTGVAAAADQCLCRQHRGGHGDRRGAGRGACLHDAPLLRPPAALLPRRVGADARRQEHPHHAACGAQRPHPDTQGGRGQVERLGCAPHHRQSAARPAVSESPKNPQKNPSKIFRKNPPQKNLS